VIRRAGLIDSSFACETNRCDSRLRKHKNQAMADHLNDKDPRNVAKNKGASDEAVHAN